MIKLKKYYISYYIYKLVYSAYLEQKKKMLNEGVPMLDTPIYSRPNNFPFPNFLIQINRFNNILKFLQQQFVS